MRHPLAISALLLTLAAVSSLQAEEGSTADRAVDKASGTVGKAMDKVARAVGATKWELEVKETDPKLKKPTLELGYSGQNTVERKTSYHPNGKRATQETREYLPSSDVVAYIEKDTWAKNGKKTQQFVQTATFDNGAQTGGDGWQKDYQQGKVVKEYKRRWTMDSKAWKEYFMQSTKFYTNGDMKERITEELDTNASTRESWGSKKPKGGRNKSTQTWNGEFKRWD